MTAAKQIEFYTHGLSFELSAASTAGPVTGSTAARTALAAANSNTNSKSTALGKGSNNNPRQAGKTVRGGRRGFASASVALSESVMSAPQAPVSAKVRFSSCRVSIPVPGLLLLPPGTAWQSCRRVAMSRICCHATCSHSIFDQLSLTSMKLFVRCTVGATGTGHGAPDWLLL